MFGDSIIGIGPDTLCRYDRSKVQSSENQILNKQLTLWFACSVTISQYCMHGSKLIFMVLSFSIKLILYHLYNCFYLYHLIVFLYRPLQLNCTVTLNFHPGSVYFVQNQCPEISSAIHSPFYHGFTRINPFHSFWNSVHHDLWN